MVKGIHHVQISVNEGDELKARDFYMELMGFQEVTRPPSLERINGCWLQAGELQLHIRTQNNLDRLRSSDHVAYQVENILEFRSLVESRNLIIQESIKIPGMERFEFRDPFGNRVEVLELE